MTDVPQTEQPQSIADSVTDTNSAAAAFGKIGLFEAAPTPEAEPAETQDTGAELELPPETTDEPTGEDGGAQADPQTEYFTVKIDGKEERVTRDELLAGYQKDKDYRQKTAKLADERKAIEAERTVIEQAKAERERLAAMLGNVIPQLEKQLTDKYAKVDWVALARENPAEWAQMRAEFDAHQQQLMFAQSEKARVDKQQRDDFERSYGERLDAEKQKLRELVPEFADPEKGKKLSDDLASHLLTERGLTKAEVSGITDHRMVLIALDAMKYRAALKARKEAANTAKPVPQVQKPGASPRTDVKAEIRKHAMGRLEKSGSVKDAAAVFRTMKIL